MTNPPIPFLDLATSHRELQEELVQAFVESLRTAHFIGGPQVESFENEFASYCGTTYCAGVGSGTDALRFALLASGVGQGDAVVTVSHTFIATVEAISQAGAETEFVDIDEGTYTMSPSALNEYLDGCQRDSKTGRPIGRRTGKPIKAVVPVHLYGQVADMDSILALAGRHGLLVIEDAAQAQGAEFLSVGEVLGNSAGLDAREGVWRRAGSLGTAAAFSFYPGKNLGACGEAGAVTTNDEEVARKVRMIRDHGQERKYYHELEGYNGRLDAIQAAFLRIKLRRLDAWNAQRRAAAGRYNELLSPIPGIITPLESDRSRAVYPVYVIRTKERDELAEHLKRNGIQTGLHYPIPVHLQKCYREWGYAKGSLPVTEQVATELLSLPMFPGLTAKQQEQITAEIGDFVEVKAAVEVSQD